MCGSFRVLNEPEKNSEVSLSLLGSGQKHLGTAAGEFMLINHGLSSRGVSVVGVGSLVCSLQRVGALVGAGSVSERDIFFGIFQNATINMINLL